MSNQDDLPEPDHVFDGGSMDCGSGLILLIRQNMLEVPEGGILEIRSSEPTVETELPPWCRMVGHVHLLSQRCSDNNWRHWVQRGSGTDAEQVELDSDRKKAQEFKFSVRARRTTKLETTVYSRTFSWQSGSSVSFDRKGALPSSLEQFLGALIADVVNCFALRCSRHKVTLDDLEGTLNASLNNSLAAVGLERGDSSVKEAKLVIYASSSAAESDIREQFELALADSPVYSTLQKACQLSSNLVLL